MRYVSKVFDLKIILIIGIALKCASGCSIVLSDDLTFLFSEVSEDYPVNTTLPKSLPFIGEPMENVKLLVCSERFEEDTAVNYIDPVVNWETNTIDFYLRHPLSEYRKEQWSPSLEFEFTLPCSADTTRYTYLLTIMDANLYKPTFSAETLYEGVLKYSHSHGFQIKFDPSSSENSNSCIRVTDQDFNLKYSNISVTCEGPDCDHFIFKTEYVGKDKGHNYDIEVKFDSNPNTVKSNLSEYSFDLIVNDSLHITTTKVNLVFVAADEISPSDSSSSPLTIIIASSVTLLVVVSCIITLSYQVLRNRKAKDLLRKLTEAEIREFLEGTANLANEVKRSVDVNTPIMALPYNKAFEIPRDKLRIDETTILGTGAFGIVWKGSVVFSNGDGITVAVKSIKRNVGVLYFKALLSELKIMAYIGKHPNIVSLVGACTHNIRKREVYIAVQYCANGNFHNYLKCRRDRFSNLVSDGEMILTNAATYSYMYSSKGCFSKTISTMNLLQWATQVANGLQYLESLGVIHGDLATRNILLDSERIAKIGDFGLSRRLIDYSDYYYTKTSQCPLPWKWMSPESLKDMKFSMKSDMWSFGMVLWEIFSLGQTPYPGLSWDETFVERLESGMRPARPSFASHRLYDIMTDCWNLEAHDRPAILDIKRALENITSSALRQKSDLSYMRFLGEVPSVTMLPEGEDGYLIPNTNKRRNSYWDV
ncbi:Fibroblast growth factor receptor 3 [Orchesella cincta]|uniref:Fibroblast growth factor receptor 3 n=1 Tax=Orchesella cincta TaxID=48709 RepID=A0A1D2MXY7_ORCCI|nr:Fibroblast growth factor receptor 3 [Orchesella cincta]